MDIEFLYWHWIVMGMGLMALEIFVGSFFILWFGASAVLVGILNLFFSGMSIAFQFVAWAVLSLALVLIWFRVIKPLNTDKTKAGLSREAILGEIGQVLKAPTADSRGKVRFPAPVLGSDEWLIISTDELVIGDRVSVVDLSGNSLIVKKA